MDKPTRICTIDGCEGKYSARGYCNRHYLRWKKYGDPMSGNDAPLAAIDHADGSRTCSSCGKCLPIEMFDKDSHAARGRRAKCKACRAVQMRQWYEGRGKTGALLARERRAANPEIVKGNEARRYAKNRDARIELSEDLFHVRRAKRAGVAYIAGITRTALRERFGDLCCYCHVTLDFERVRRGEHKSNLATIEHVKPISLGGAHTWDNVRLACWSCNSSKRGMTVEEWRARGNGMEDNRVSLGNQG